MMTKLGAAALGLIASNVGAVGAGLVLEKASAGRIDVLDEAIALLGATSPKGLDPVHEQFHELERTHGVETGSLTSMVWSVKARLKRIEGVKIARGETAVSHSSLKDSLDEGRESDDALNSQIADAWRAAEEKNK